MFSLISLTVVHEAQPVAHHLADRAKFQIGMAIGLCGAVCQCDMVSTLIIRILIHLGLRS